MRDCRASESTITAIASTAPVIMKRSEDDRFSSVRPLAIDWITMMPSTAEYALPRPPNRLVPPITGADIDTCPPRGLVIAADRQRSQIARAHPFDEGGDGAADPGGVLDADIAAVEQRGRLRSALRFIAQRPAEHLDRVIILHFFDP